MKECPSCKTVYTDDSLSYCLSDGAALVDCVAEQPTVVRAAGMNEPLHIDIAAPSDKTFAVGPEVESRRQAFALSTATKVIVAVVVIGILALVGLGLASFAVYYATGSSQPGTAAEPPTPLPTALPAVTTDPEKDRLRDEIANIQRQLDEQKKNAGNSDHLDDELGSPVTATVNSPNDGFLALRSQPDAERGERLARIPHGVDVEVLRCGSGKVTIGSRSGRWCYVEYDGLNGWVFDAWLEY